LYVVGKQQWLMESGGDRQGCQDTPSAATPVSFFLAKDRLNRVHLNLLARHCEAAEIFDAQYWCIQ
jgi:hypothetical protein